MNGHEKTQLAVSVGGSKCACAVVGGVDPPAVLASSGRIEWTREDIQTIEAFVGMLVLEIQKLLEQPQISGARIERVGVAWPGPGTGGYFEATFVPGCKQRQPIPLLLRSALTTAFGSRFESIPIRIMLDAVARAAGEAEPDGALHVAPGEQSPVGLLINVATGIAGGIVRAGRAFLTYPGLGENYGQFGRFLFMNTSTGDWDWRPTTDGSVPRHSLPEVRWTRQCAGPALARRIAHFCHTSGIEGHDQNSAVAIALHHYQAESAPRHAAHEMTLLRWATAEASRCPEGPLARFVGEVAREIGGALHALLRVFASERIDRVVLAGGVGENFGRDDASGNDPFLMRVQLAMGSTSPRVSRARLGVDAEFLGLASNSFIQRNDIAHKS